MRYEIEEETIWPKVAGLVFVLFCLGVVGEMDYQDAKAAAEAPECVKKDGVKVCTRKTHLDTNSDKGE